MRLTIFSVAVMTGCALLVSCKKFVQLSAPETSITKSEVYNDSLKATAVVSYIYYDMANTFAEGYKGVGVLSSLAADELKSYNTNLDYIGIAQNDMQTNNAPNAALWADAYKNLYQANLVMDNIANATGLSVAVKNQLNGECKFIRAYLHFYLANLYGDVPLMLTSNYQVNAVAGRTPVSKVYESVLADLKDAQSLLTDNYMSGANKTTKDRLRPNKSVVAALLARVYLYQEDWVDAEAAATSLINNTTYQLEPDLKNIFLATSREGIWELQSPTAPYCTLEGDYYIMQSVPIPFNSLSTILASAVSPRLLNAFEPDDQRRTNWISSFTSDTSTWLFPYKYKSSNFISTYVNTGIASENLMVFRLAEEYLVRAEARARLGKLTGTGGATEDIDAIRARAGLGPVAATSLKDVMLAIEQERKIELFTEGGQRWLDLKRWKGFNNPAITRADEVMPAACTEKGGTWNTNRSLFPIPISEFTNDPNLGNQNPGYNL